MSHPRIPSSAHLCLTPVSRLFVATIVLAVSVAAFGQTTTIALLPSLATYVNLIPGPSGQFYGTYDGAVNDCSIKNCGAVFELRPNSNGGWTTTLLHSFNGTDGLLPNGNLLLDSMGNLYGTTSAGGDLFGKSTGPCLGWGCGVVFKLAPQSDGTWVETVLHSFEGGQDGTAPSSLTFGSSGTLLGTAASGGAALCSGTACGTIFQLTPGTQGVWQKSVLYNFTGGSKGQFPSQMLLDPAGNIYGLASGGLIEEACAQLYCGVVFKLTKSNGQWKETVIHAFQGSDGSFPNSLLMRNSKLYGTTKEGGSACAYPGCGTIYELSSRNGVWQQSILYDFDGVTGNLPSSKLAFASNGKIYGGVQLGEPDQCNPFQYGNCGTVLEFTSNSGVWNVSNQFGTPGWWVPTGNIIVTSAGQVFAAAGDWYYYNGAEVFEITP